jgi:hypothetical protein
MKKIYIYTTIIAFLGTINLISAQNVARRNEFSICTGVNKNELMDTYGNDLGLEMQHNFNRKMSLAAAWTLGNGYKIYYRNDPRNKTYYYNTFGLSMNFSPFKSNKWRFGAGYINQFLQNASFLSMYLPWCATGMSDEQLRASADLYQRTKTSSFNFSGINLNIQRKFRVTKRNNILVRLEMSQFGGVSELFYVDKYPRIMSFNVGWGF